MNSLIPIAFAVVVASATAFLSNELKTLYLSSSDPFVFSSALATPEMLLPGEPITITYEFERFRLCQVDLNLFIVHNETKKVVWRNRVPGGATLLGKIVVLNQFDIPTLPPGEYTFRTINYAQCIEGGAHIIATPDVNFTVKSNIKEL